jgi:hypothetical protein
MFGERLAKAMADLDSELPFWDRLFHSWIEFPGLNVSGSRLNRSPKLWSAGTVP